MLKRVVSITAMAALVLAACGGDDSDGSSGATGGGTETSGGGTAATGTPIKLGSVSSYSGAQIFPEPSTTAEAIFEEVNRNGGIKGHPIEYIIEDDTNTPEGAAAAAKKLVEEDQVLAMVGGGSIVDCTTNAKYYLEQDILSLAGANACGPEAGNIASMNTGPFLGTVMTMQYMVEEMGVQTMCFVGRNTGLTPILTGTFIPQWEQVSGKKVKSLIIQEESEDLTIAATKLKQDGCDGALLAYTEPDYIAFGQVANAQGLNDGSVVFAMLTSGYSLEVLDKLGNNGEGWISNSEFLPYTEEEGVSEQLDEFKTILEENDQPLTSFAQSGYLAAKAMIEILESVEGEYTRESVSAAMKEMNYETDMLGAPATWIPYENGKQLNTSSKIVQITDGKFVTISDWVFWPPKK
jgi:branched-chain amino acid transport system substrate-binding protein